MDWMKGYNEIKGLKQLQKLPLTEIRSTQLGLKTHNLVFFSRFQSVDALASLERSQWDLPG